jgi:hypothetical protein
MAISFSRFEYITENITLLVDFANLCYWFGVKRNVKNAVLAIMETVKELRKRIGVKVEIVLPEDVYWELYYAYNKTFIFKDFTVFQTSDETGQEHDDHFLIHRALDLLSKGKKVAILSRDRFVSALKTINGSPISAVFANTKQPYKVRQVDNFARAQKYWLGAYFIGSEGETIRLLSDVDLDIVKNCLNPIVIEKPSPPMKLFTYNGPAVKKQPVKQFPIKKLTVQEKKPSKNLFQLVNGEVKVSTQETPPPVNNEEKVQQSSIPSKSKIFNTFTEDSRIGQLVLSAMAVMEKKNN